MADIALFLSASTIDTCIDKGRVALDVTRAVYGQTDSLNSGAGFSLCPAFGHIWPDSSSPGQNKELYLTNGREDLLSKSYLCLGLPLALCCIGMLMERQSFSGAMTLIERKEGYLMSSSSSAHSMIGVSKKVI